MTQAARGVVTHSSGNHGAALALAARTRGIACHVVVPQGAVPAKLAAIAAYGAMLHHCAPTIAAREAHVRAGAARDRRRTGASLHRSAGDRRPGHRGAGTAEPECACDVSTRLLVPVGGGGLAAGTALAAAAMSPRRGVFAAEPAGAAETATSLQRGERVTDFVPDTVCDGLRGTLGAPNFALLQRASRRSADGRRRRHARRDAPAVAARQAAGGTVVGDRARRGAGASRTLRRPTRRHHPVRRQCRPGRAAAAVRAHRRQRPAHGSRSARIAASAVALRKTPMRALLRSPNVWIAALALRWRLLFLGSRGIWDPDEGRYTNVALHMLDSGDWIDPHRSDEVNHWTKPPLTYWAIACERRGVRPQRRGGAPAGGAVVPAVRVAGMADRAAAGAGQRSPGRPRCLRDDAVSVRRRAAHHHRLPARGVRDAGDVGIRRSALSAGMRAAAGSR